MNRHQVCQQQVQNARSADIILQPGGSDNSDPQTSLKPVSSNVLNVGSPGENTTETQLPFCKTLERSYPKKVNLSGIASLLPQAEPEAFRFLTKSYIVTGSLNLVIFRFKIIHIRKIYPYNGSNTYDSVKKFIYLKGNRELKT